MKVLTATELRSRLYRVLDEVAEGRTRRRPEAERVATRDRDEREDRGDFDRGEPELELTVRARRQQVRGRQQHHQREPDLPHRQRDPQLQDCGTGDGLDADDDDSEVPVQPAADEPCPGAKPGTRVVSNTFTMGEWQADQTGTVGEESCQSWCTALLWIVPARAAGRYNIPDGELVLKQEFQMLSGTLRTAGGPVAVQGRVRGEDVSFTANGKKYHGRMNGGRLVLQ